MPHYHAEEATRALKPVLGDYYTFDDREVLPAINEATFRSCSYTMQASLAASCAAPVLLVLNSCYASEPCCFTYRSSLASFSPAASHPTLPHRHPVADTLAVLSCCRCTLRCGRTGSTRALCRKRRMAAAYFGMATMARSRRWLEKRVGN